MPDLLRDKPGRATYLGTSPFQSCFLGMPKGGMLLLARRAIV